MYLVVSAVIVIGLFFISNYSYLLFHSLIEIFAILVASAVFVIGWNSVSENRFFKFVGVSYIFIAAIDILHTLSYSGTGIFPGYDANLPTQLWILARYIEASVLLIAPYIMNKKIEKNYLVLVFSVIVGFSLVSIFLGIFPVCFVVGEGLTLFKITSEYVIAGILVLAAYSYYVRQEKFDSSVLNLIYGSIALTIAAEMAFTLYADPYGLANMLGHYLRFASYYLIYKAIVQSSLVRPFEVMFRDLKQSEQSLIEANDILELTTKMVRHDIRHELSVITLSIELYQQSKNIDMLHQVLESIARCNELIETTRQMTQPAISDEEMYEVSIRDTILRAVGTSTMIISIAGDGHVIAGAALLSVFRNIIKNAEIHSKAKRLEIIIESVGDNCETRLSDSGQGIPEGIRDRIFDEGFTAGDTGGSGLGLYIVKRLVESYKGTISVESNQPSGTTFIVSLPCIKKD